MLKNIHFYLTIFIISISSANAQSILSENLAKIVSERPDQATQILIVLDETLSFEKLKNQLDQANLKPQERANLLRQMLQINRKVNQKDVADYLLFLQNANKNNVQELTSFWIVNVIATTVKAKFLPEIANLRGVSSILLEQDYRLIMDKIVSEEIIDKESIGGIEPGLSAIGAPFMWQMGYTGNGAKAYIVDTGIWPKHPAIRNRWLGNRWPLAHAWQPFDRDFPADKTSSHGSHVSGIVCGLDTATNDTIGVAPNAYFISTDPIVSNLAVVKPVQTILSSFEFAFNPDGDTTTTHDIPDAINNSWGFATPNDSTLCNGFMANLAMVMETSGIATIFAAGNEGPDPQTVGTPQFISPSILSWFTVGALNGANPNFPIADFSSRGASICHSTGPLSIKPEVSAPGVGVRSCVGNSSYSAYNGTSMAAPHVTGAIMLLKEAFPQLTGVEIMAALYNSAIDLGAPGEDNSYGNGIINLQAAYQLLATNNSPSMPKSKDWDLALVDVLQPNYQTKSTCNGMENVRIVVQNIGNQTINQIILTVNNSGQTVQFPMYNLTLSPGAIDTISFITIGTPLLQWSQGFQELIFRVEIVQSVNEYDNINNQIAVRFHSSVGGLPTPYVVPFDSMSVTKSGWITDNPDNDQVFWDSITAIGAFSSKAMYIRNSISQVRNFQLDHLHSPVFNINSNMVLRFQLASTSRATPFRDSLRIYASTDCGATFTDLIYNNGGFGIRTYQGSRPTLPSHWRTETIDLSAYAGQQVMLRFTNQYDMGGDLYLANLEVAQATSITPTAVNYTFSVYPNPSQGLLFIEVGNHTKELPVNITLTNLMGQVLRSETTQFANQDKKQMDIKNLPNGIYLLELKSAANRTQFKIVLTK